jgi:hypothetical protein
MSVWDQRIRNHGVWAAMKALGPAIDNVVAVPEIEAEALVGLERIRAALAFIGKRLAAADPFTCFPSPLDTISERLIGALALIERFPSERNIQLIIDANMGIDTALEFVNRVPVQMDGDIGTLVESTTSFRTDLERRLFASRNAQEQAKGYIDELQAKVAELSGTIQSERDRVSQTIAEYQRQFAEGQEKRAHDSNDILNQAQQRITAITADYQSQFSSGQETRNKEFSEARSTQEQRFNALLQDDTTRHAEQNTAAANDRAELLRSIQEKLADLNTDFAGTAKNILKEIEADRTRVEKLVGVIGNLGVTSGYLRAANHARYSMWVWQALALAAMITLSYLAFHTFSLLEDKTGHFNWGGFAGRAIFLASLGVIAAYAASQADKLYNSEKRNRRLALELEAIGPYLAPLSEDERNKFRVLMGERTFGREELSPEMNERSPSTVLDILMSKEGKQVLETLTGLVKTLKP